MYIILYAVFRYFLLSEVPHNFGVDKTVVNAGVITFGLTINILMGMHLYFNDGVTILTKILTLGLNFIQFIFVPLLDLAAQNSKSLFNGSCTTTISSSFVTIIILFLLPIYFLHIKFSLQIFRKHSIKWNHSNQFKLYYLIFNTIRVLYIVYNGLTIQFCFFCLFAEYFMENNRTNQLNYHSLIMDDPQYYCIPMTHLSLLLTLLFKNAYFGFGIWLFSMSAAFGYTVLSYYNTNNALLYIPACDAHVEQFYGFYFRFKEEYKLDKYDGMGCLTFPMVFKLHQIHCKDVTCKIKHIVQEKQQSDKMVQEVVNRAIEVRKGQSLDLRVLWQLWCFQTGRKHDFQALRGKVYSLKHQFIVHSVLTAIKSKQGTMQLSENNQNMLPSIFYDSLFELCSEYWTFYEQLSKVHPKIGKVIIAGGGIYMMIARLKKIYLELIKSKMLNFKMIELYLSFFTCFVNENIIDKETICRLMKLQKRMHFEEISQSFLPTFLVQPETGVIWNVNSQAQKYLQCTRFQLKYMDITQMMLPRVNIDQLVDRIGNGRHERIYTLFRRPYGEMLCTRLLIENKIIKMKKYISIELLKQSYSPLKTIFLIDKNFQIEYLQHYNLVVKLPNSRTCQTYSWMQLYKKYVLPQKSRLVTARLAKVQTSQNNCTIVMKLMRTAHDKHHILIATFVVVRKITQTRRQSLMQVKHQFKLRIKRNNQFQFHFDEYEAQYCLLAYKDDSKWRRNNKKRAINVQDLWNKQQTNEIRVPIVYDKQIKTYRLWRGELYNVDLEQKEPYQLFEAHVQPQGQGGQGSQRNFQTLILFGVVLLCVVLVGLGFLLIGTFGTSSTMLSEQYKRYQNIEKFFLDFNRIIAVFRDACNGFFEQFPSLSYVHQTIKSFSRILSLKQDKIFSNTEYTFSNVSITLSNLSGTLNQLTDAVLASIHQSVSSNSLQLMQSIRQLCAQQLNTLVLTELNMVSLTIDNSINDTLSFKNIVIYVSLALVLLLNVLMLVYCFKSNELIKSKLVDLLYYSDGEIRLFQQNADNMKYAIEMTRKHYDVDTQNLLTKTNSCAKRKNPKQAIIGSQTIYCVLGLVLVSFIVHVGMIVYASISIESQLKKFVMLKDQGNQVVGLYGNLSLMSSTMNTLGVLQHGSLKMLRDNLQAVQQQFLTNYYTQSTKTILNTLLYDNSCRLLHTNYNINQQSCSNITPTQHITSPFGLGLLYYFHSQYYALKIDPKQGYEITGMFSQEITEVFLNVVELLLDDGLMTLNGMFGRFGSVCIGIMFVDGLYLIVFIAFSWYYRVQMGKIKSIVQFFNSRKKVVQKVEQSDDQDEDNESSSLSELSISPKKRKMTIQNVILRNA